MQGDGCYKAIFSLINGEHRVVQAKPGSTDGPGS